MSLVKMLNQDSFRIINVNPIEKYFLLYCDSLSNELYTPESNFESLKNDVEFLNLEIKEGYAWDGNGLIPKNKYKECKAKD